METLPWEPPDGVPGVCVEALQGSRSVWDVGVDVDAATCSSQVGGHHGLERLGREGDDAHGASPTGSDLGVDLAGSQAVHLNLGLTDITRYSSYSKLWRTLYFVNDAPFCIRNYGLINAAGEWTVQLIT